MCVLWRSLEEVAANWSRCDSQPPAAAMGLASWWEPAATSAMMGRAQRDGVEAPPLHSLCEPTATLCISATTCCMVDCRPCEHNCHCQLKIAHVVQVREVLSVSVAPGQPAESLSQPATGCEGTVCTLPGSVHCSHCPTKDSAPPQWAPPPALNLPAGPHCPHACGSSTKSNGASRTRSAPSS